MRMVDYYEHPERGKGWYYWDQFTRHLEGPKESKEEAYSALDQLIDEHMHRGPRR